MPSINIYDVDKTKAGVGSAINFSVVIPGYVKNIGKFDEVADQNGVYECSSLADFKEYVGTISNAAISGQTLPGNFAEARLLDTTKTNIDRYIWASTITAATAKYEEFKNFYYNNEGKIYTIPATDDNTPSTSGFTKYSEYIAYQHTEPGAEPGDDPVITTKYRKITEVTTLPAIGVYTNNRYVVIDCLGNDTQTINGAGYGNQIAYELISMGYTVLYKKVIASANYVDPGFYEPLLDKTSYSFRFITCGFNSTTQVTAAAGGDSSVTLSAIYTQLLKVANSRKDCIALLDIDEDKYNGLTSYKSKINAAKLGADEITGTLNYCGIFTPGVVYSSLGSAAEFNNNCKMPASFHYLACFYESLIKGYAEWYAVAGETRGVCGYNIASATVDFGADAATALEPRTNDSAKNPLGLTKSVNVITKFKKLYLLWGNRTGATIGSELVATNFLNIRQLVSTLSQELYVACKRFSFDPNNDTLWINFCTTIRPTLERMKANEGIKDYKIQKVYTNQKAMFKARVRIIPIEAVEDFDIEITLEDTFGTTALSVAESNV